MLDRVIGQLVEAAQGQGRPEPDAAQVLPRDGAARRTAPCSSRARCSPTPPGKRLFIADTGHNRIVQTDLDGSEPDRRSAAARRASSTAPIDKADVQPAPGDVPGRRDALRRRHREPRDPRGRPEGAARSTTIAGTGSQAPRHSATGRVGTGQDDRALQPLGRDPASRRQGALHRHGRPAPDLEARPRLGNDQRLRRLGQREHRRRPPRPRPASPSRAAWPPTARTCSSPTPRSRASGSITGIDSRAARGPDDRRPGPLRLRRPRRHAAQTVRLQHCLGLAYGDGHLYIADTYNNKIKVCDPRTRSVKTLVGFAQAGRQRRPAAVLRARRPERRRRPTSTSPTPTTTRSGSSTSRPHAVKTLALDGLTPPRLGPAAAELSRTRRSIDVAAAEVAPGQVDRRSTSRSRCPRASSSTRKRRCPTWSRRRARPASLRPRCGRTARRSSRRPRSSRSTSRWPSPPRRATRSTCASRFRRSSAARRRASA